MPFEPGIEPDVGPGALSLMDKKKKESSAKTQMQAAKTQIDQEFGDLFDDDTPLACGIENPEHCESCQ